MVDFKVSVVSKRYRMLYNCKQIDEKTSTQQTTTSQARIKLQKIRKLGQQRRKEKESKGKTLITV